MICTLWQEIVRGGGIARPPKSSLYGAGDHPQLCGAHGTHSSRAVVALLLVHREIHLLSPSGRIWRENPCIRGYGDATLEVVMSVGCRLMRIASALGNGI